MSEAFCQEGNGASALVLEDEEICIGQALDGLETKEAHGRIEYKILPLLPCLPAGTAGFKRVVPLFSPFLCACHRCILRPERLEQQLISSR